ncbi:maltodextrin glucosidase [Photobacterium sanctipauli]|uniref:Maltodextrin glucosidase n=2 Tax=Photobacterium sanctipauli TaxID=1342794 RepID=A0A2T3NZ62_9GAMM|nr:maltodextrin glucosidase [Photobacterium sanctipauli]PSW21563.1 maltodextrin glucosidase [Photobacterium sanctipauli]
MKVPYLYHGQDAFWVTPQQDQLLLSLASDADMLISTIFVRCEPDNEESLIDMERGELNGKLQFWHAKLPLNQDKAITHYCFKVMQNSRQWWLHGKGISPRMPGREYHFKYNSQHQPPAWVKSQVFYQIFPDRFCNSDPSLNVKSNEYYLQGTKRPTIAMEWGEKVSDHGKNGPNEFFGGDLAGIHDKFDYLQKLGITALYLNPIFKAPSNHKYDTSDYQTIDPHLGTNEQFAHMVEDLHDRGMKIMLDAVYNHTSVDHHWFDKYSKNSDNGLETKGAYGNPDSPYRDYYQFDGDGNDYIGWNGISTLPKLNFSNPEVQDYIYAGDEAVIKTWLRPPYNIDAWRFDVIHMLGEGAGAKNNAHYVKAFRDAAKSVNPDCYVLGEHFFEATSWLQGDQEDGAMNYYGFAHPIRAFFANKDIAYHNIQIEAEELVDWLNEARSKVPWLNQLSQLNQLDSHDTMRFLTMLDGDKETMQLALMMLFSYVGAPCIYYGTEVSLEGGQDPDNRRCFPWERTETPHTTFDYVQQLVELRKTRPSLQEGSIQWLFAEHKHFGFARTLNGETTLCLINNGSQAKTLEVPVWQLGIEQGQLTDLLNQDEWSVKDGVLSITLASKEGLLLAH